MRCVRTKDRSYIWNAWSDGKTQYRAENMAGLTWRALVEAGAKSSEIQARVDFYLRRAPEEFYDMTGDRSERRNLIGDPARRAEIEALRADLLALMRRTGDPLAEAFAQRGDARKLDDAMEKLKSEYQRPAKGGKGKAAKRGAKAPAEAAGKVPAAAPAQAGPREADRAPDSGCVRGDRARDAADRAPFAEQAGEQALTVTLLAGKGRARLARKVVKSGARAWLKSRSCCGRAVGPVRPVRRVRRRGLQDNAGPHPERAGARQMSTSA
jgi:hypothetical protein